jgi:hypothetical protein
MITVAILAVPAHAQPRLSDSIVVDQFGYRAQSKKVAVFRAPQLGKDAPTPSNYTPGNTIRVIREEDAGNNIVYSGQATAFKGGAVDEKSGDKIWHFDFTGVTEPGRYHIRDEANGLRSFSFRIADDVYNDVLKAAVRMLFYQRAGIAKPAQYAFEEWADVMCYDQDRRSRYKEAPNNASLERDLRGGWFDAGDYGKYTRWTAGYVSDLLLAYEENPDAFSDDYGIPESGNGIPDILDEAKWGIDWLLRMQNPDGSTLSAQGLKGASPPSADNETTYYGPPNTTATLGVTGAFSVASRVFRSIGEVEFADELKTAALKAWEWAKQYPDSIAHSKDLTAGDPEVWEGTGRNENRLIAAYYLFELTKDESLLNIVEQEMGIIEPNCWWTDFYHHERNMVIMRYLSHPSVANRPGRSSIHSCLRSAFGSSINPDLAANDGYRSHIGDYNWGSNKSKANFGESFYKWSVLDPSVDHRDIAEEYLHYIHGVNPLNTVYLTNMGRYGASKSLTKLFHTWFAGSKWGETKSGSPGPAPGFMAGGPNQYYECEASDCEQRRAPKQGDPHAKMYMDLNMDDHWQFKAWEITEPSNGYQTGYIRLLSKFASKGDTTSTATRKPETKIAPVNKTSLITVRHRTIKTHGSPDTEVRIRVVNLSGRTIAGFNTTGGAILSLKKIPAGVYIIEARRVKDGMKITSNAVLR